MANESEKLVTLGGECFEATFQSKEIVANRDGVCYLEDPTSINQLRSELQGIWASAVPVR
jgi:hypothetical protein